MRRQPTYMKASKTRVIALSSSRSDLGEGRVPWWTVAATLGSTSPDT